MQVLCNLPLECFEARPAFRQRIVTYGPPQRMHVDGAFFPFDVAYDPSTEPIEALWRRLPRSFRPDILLLWWPDQEPLPVGLERCPCPVVGVLSDYNLSLPYVAGLWPYFDVLLVDRPGVELLRRLSFADVRHFVQYSFKPHHRIWPGVARDVDVAFAGNLNPVVQPGRAPWLARVERLRALGVATQIATGLDGPAYGRFLSRARIGFNRSIRGEMNLRAFEVPACGALLLMEAENTEVRDFFVPGAEVVLYGEDDFEAIVLDLLADEPRRARIAAAGHARVQELRMSRRMDAMAALLSVKGPGRPGATPFDLALGRGVALLLTWAAGAAAERALLAAARLEPQDPRPLNALALAALRARGASALPEAVTLLQRACALSSSYVPAAANLAFVLGAAGQASAGEWRRRVEERLSAVRAWEDLDGPRLPLGYSAPAIRVAGALREAVLAGGWVGRVEAWGV